MRPLHAALTAALLRCHLFSKHGALQPFSFPSECRVRDVARADVPHLYPHWPYLRIGDPGGPDPGAEGVPGEVVRVAWEKACPWLAVPLPDWWAFKVRVVLLLLARWPCAQ